jgi:hypothetical protein
MPKCKLANCREEALPTGKRYCAAHKAAYLAKQREYRRVQETLPDCEDCGCKLSVTAAQNGLTLCRECTTRQEEVERANRAAEARLRLQQAKLDQIDACTSIDEIKQFIKEHLL